MPRGLYKTKFRRNVKESREFIKENESQLLKLLEYIGRRNDKKIKKELIDSSGPRAKRKLIND